MAEKLPLQNDPKNQDVNPTLRKAPIKDPEHVAGPLEPATGTARVAPPSGQPTGVTDRDVELAKMAKPIRGTVTPEDVASARHAAEHDQDKSAVHTEETILLDAESRALRRLDVDTTDTDQGKFQKLLNDPTTDDGMLAALLAKSGTWETLTVTNAEGTRQVRSFNPDGSPETVRALRKLGFDDWADGAVARARRLGHPVDREELDRSERARAKANRLTRHPRDTD